MIVFRIRRLRLFVASMASTIIACIGLLPAAFGQSNLPQHSYMCRKNGVMVGRKLVNYITRINTADQDFTTDKLSVAPEAYGKAFVRHLIEAYKPDNSTALEMESYNWGSTCVTSWPYGGAALEASHKYAVNTEGAVEIDWAYTPDQAVAHATPPQPAEAATSSESVTYDCDGGPAAGGFRILATYYFAPRWRTPTKAAVTLDGKTTELARDGSDAAGLTFGAAEIGISKFQGGAHVYRGSKASNCVAR